MRPTGKARLAGVMGWPVSHSRSPVLHGHWLDRHGIDGAYVPMAVDPAHLEQAIRALPVLGFRGCNLTVPHKEAALSLVDQVDPVARRIGAINTLVVGEGGIEGRNTDGVGFMENLKAGHAGFAASHGPVVVLGAGGAARAVIVALADAGAPEIRVANRSPGRTAALVAEFGPPLVAVPWEARAEALDGAALLVNTTTLGMVGQEPLALALDLLPVTALVTDIVYTPLETDLLARARARGNPVVDGLGMLLHQARPGFAAWFGVVPEVDENLRRAVLGA